MPSFGTIARNQQAYFRSTSETVSSAGRSPSDEKGRRNGHLLALGSESENLYPFIRGENGAARFFRERSIKWWRNSRSGDSPGKKGQPATWQVPKLLA